MIPEPLFLSEYPALAAGMSMKTDLRVVAYSVYG